MLLTRLENAGKALEDALLVIILGLMIFIATGQIVLRNFFDIGFIWTDELLRMLVLWITMAGAVAASRKDRHISIAVLDRFLPKKLIHVSQVILDLFTASICAVICWHSFLFVKDTYAYGDLLLGSTPAWILQSILPLGFGLISWRYLIFAIRGFSGRARISEAP